MSPQVKTMVSTMAKPSAELRAIDHIIVLGNVIAAFLVSSATKVRRAKGEARLNLHICTVLSNPPRVTTIAFRPTIKDTPLVDQPPLLVNSVKTALALFLGERTKRGIIMANKPTIWSSNIIPSIYYILVGKKVYTAPVDKVRRYLQQEYERDT